VTEPREQFVHVLKHGPVPDIGDIIQRKVDEEREMGFDRKWRVTGWLKAVPLEALLTGDFLKDVLLETASRAEEIGMVMVWCTRQEATHVSGSGVAGCLLHISEVEVVGRVNWTEDQIESERHSHMRIIGEYLI